MSNQNPKPILKSRTTQNVAGGTAASFGTVAAVITCLRTLNMLPWEAEYDGEVITTISVVLVPFVSRAIAFLRTPGKRVSRWLPLILVLLLPTWLGCATSRSSFSEITADGGSTEFETVVYATAGSKLAEGAGAMDYSGQEWRLRVGQSAKGLQAGGDPVAILQEIMSTLRILAPYLQQPQQPEPDPLPAP